MTKTGKRYPAEVKRRAVEEVIHGHKSINQVAREVEAVPNTVQKWLKVRSASNKSFPLDSRLRGNDSYTEMTRIRE